MDWKRFDSTLPNFVVDAVFDMLEESIAFDQMEIEGDVQLLSPSAAERLRKVFRWLRWNFTNTKIMLPDGRMLRKGHGIPSGSYFTSLVGSLGNAIC